MSRKLTSGSDLKEKKKYYLCFSVYRIFHFKLLLLLILSSLFQHSCHFSLRFGLLNNIFYYDLIFKKNNFNNLDFEVRNLNIQKIIILFAENWEIQNSPNQTICTSV